MTNTQQAVPQLDTPIVQEMVGSTSDGKRVNVPGGIISIPWYRFLISLWNRTGGGTGNVGLATGAMYVWPGDAGNIPSTTLLCDGTAVSRTQYSGLFSVIGVKFGAGDGSTTFNLPNLQDRVVIGASGTKPAGATGGENSLTLTEAQLPVVTPLLTDPGHTHMVTDPGHAHAQQVVSNNTAGTAGTQGANAADTTAVGATLGNVTGIGVNSATTGITVAPFGNGDPIDITPKYLALPWVIET